jgi:hypothetical protein
MEKPLIINDHKKVEDVYKQSEEFLCKDSTLLAEIAKYLWAYNQIGSLVPQTLDNFWSGHYFPFSESYYELENSFELCKQGFYRYSFFALRCVLELGVMGLYFDKDDQSHIDVQNWIHSQDSTPYFRPCLKRLFELSYFQQFDTKFKLQEKIIATYYYLSDFVHVRGYKYSTTGQTISNFNQFNKQSFHQYVECMRKIVKDMIIMMLLKYPIGMQELPLWEKFGFNTPMGGFLEDHHQDWVFSVLESEIKEFLKNISDNNPEVIEIVAGINKMPDLTEEQIKNREMIWINWWNNIALK